VIHSNWPNLAHRFRDKGRFLSKIAIYFNPLGILYRALVLKTRVEGDTCIRFNTIPQRDRQTNRRTELEQEAQLMLTNPRDAMVPGRADDARPSYCVFSIFKMAAVRRLLGFFIFPQFL